MPGLDDLHFDRPSAPEPEPEPRDPAKTFVLVGLIVAAIIVVGLVWWARRPPAATNAPLPTAAKATEAVKPPQAVSGENIDLPPLADSDSLVRQLVGRLSSHPRVARWLTTDQLIRDFTVVVVNIADGRTPTQHLQKMRPGGAFAAARDAQGAYINPESYHRYDADADAVSGLDPQGTARLYETLKPRIQDAYRELGYPNGDVDSALERAIVLLLKTPVVDGRIGLNGPPPLYTFADDRLELLAGSQRQLLRMGPRNERLVQEKLRAIAPLVGIAPQALPPPKVVHDRGSPPS
jgi:hypothetical protein